MKFFRIDLLTLLISLFILNSCKNPDGVGLGLNPSTQLSGSFTDTATIVANTQLDTTVITSGITKTPLGFFNDPLMGTTQADMAVTLNLPGGAAFTIPSGNLTIDSTVLVMKYTDSFYGDTLTSKYQINVYQLQNQIVNQTTYYNNTNWGDYTNAPLLGTKSFFARLHDTIKITNIIGGQPDTLVKASPQLRIRLSNDFINNNLFNASLTQVSSNIVFQHNIRGFYLNIDQTKSTGVGGVFMFNTDSCMVNVYYKSVNGTTIDTTMLTLPLSTHAAKIIHNYSAEVKAAISSKAPNGLIYLQGLAGTRVKISFPYLKNFIKNNNIVINRAELEVIPNPGTITAIFQPQPKLTLYRYDIAHQPIELPDAGGDGRSVSVGEFGGFYSPTANGYHFIVTSYLQDLISGKAIDYGTYLAPVDNSNTASVDIAATPETAGRTVAVGTVTDPNAANYPYRIKLNIYYTKIKKTN